MDIRERSAITVGLVDPVWVGHHETYFKAFIEALQKAGVRVLAVCPEPGALRELSVCYPDTLRVGKLEDPGGSRLLRGKDHDPIVTRKRWSCANRALSSLEASSHWKVDFVFFAWLDSYLRFMMSKGQADRLIGHRPWVGLYFRSQHLSCVQRGLLGRVKEYLKGDFVLRATGCRGVAGLDEQTLPLVKDYSQKPVWLFPDITNEAAADVNDPLARLIVEKANGRKIIGMISLEKRKGFMTLLRAARRAEEAGKPWFFAFTGVLWWESLSEKDSVWLKDYLANKPSNIFLDPEAGPLPDGACYNGVASSFDVLYAAYLNSHYNGSSNVLTKAGLLKRPVVVTRGACLEERVKEYQLGLAIDEDNDVQALEAIDRVLRLQDWQGQPLQPQYEAYFDQHSLARLAQNMGNVIELALAK